MDIIHQLFKQWLRYESNAIKSNA